MSNVRVMRFAALFAGATLMVAATSTQNAMANSASAYWTMPWENNSGGSSSSGGASGGFFDLFGGNSNTTSGSYGGASSGRQMVRFSTAYAPGQIIVSFSDRRLYYIHSRGQAISYPIAAPRPQSRWTGTMNVSTKRVNPSWTPTASMRLENPNLPAFVPGGHPRNPLGNRALYLGSSLYRIHGTDAPWTIGQAVSKGCIRMFNADVADLYNRIPVGTKVTVSYNRYASAAW